MAENVQMSAGDDTPKAPGTDEVGPTLQVRPSAQAQPGDNPLVTLQMTEAEVGEWWKRVEQARERIKQRTEKWDILIEEYLPVIEKTGSAETAKINAHFRNVHTKLGQLFYRSPDLILEPKDPGPGNNKMPSPAPPQPGAPPPPPLSMEDVVSIKQAVLMSTLGRDGINASRLMDELLFDVLAWAGIGCCKVGYRCVMKSIPQPKMGPAPIPPTPPTMPGSVLGLSQPQGPPPMIPMMDPTGAPIMENVQSVIHEEWYARRFSPKKLLANADLRSTRFKEDATFLGMEFFVSPKTAMKPVDQGGFGLTEEEAAKASPDTLVHEYPEDKSSEGVGLIRGVELWVKASIFGDEPHPLAINQLILLEGVTNRPIAWRPSPDQEFNEKGQLTEDSLLGFPINVLTIRDLADSMFPPSDAAFVNTQVKQLNTSRRQSVKYRDAAIGKYLVDSGAFEDEDVDKIQNGDVGDFIFVKEGALAQGADKIIVPIGQVRASIDDYQTSSILKQDMDETLGINSEQAGSPERTVRTATATATVATAVAARNDKERSRVVDFYLDLVRQVDQLLMRYADSDQYVHVTGDDGARIMQMWNNKLISGRYIYDIAPDSQARADTAVDFQQGLNFYNIAAKDPLFNRTYMLRRLARMKGLDPSKVVIPIPPQPPKAVPPSVGFSFKGEDLQDPEVRAILEKAELLPGPLVRGAQPPAGPVQPPHGGGGALGEAVNQHSASNSGKRPSEPGSTNMRQEQVK